MEKGFSFALPFTPLLTRLLPASTARRSRTAERSESVSEEAEDLRCLSELVSRRTLSLPPDYTVSCNTFLPVYTFVCTDKQRQSTGRTCKVS